MPYTFSDANGYLDTGPTVDTVGQIKKLMAEYKQRRPAFEQLLEHGHTNLLPALGLEARQLSKKTTDKAIKHSLLRIAALARKAEEVLVLEQ